MNFDDKIKPKRIEMRYHPKNCTCKAHQFIKDNSTRNFPIVWNLCPSHHSTWWHCELPFISLKERIFVKFSIRFGLFKILKVRYIDESCDFCRILDGGIGLGIVQ